MASARNYKFQWKVGEEFRTRLFMLNDRYAQLPPGVIKASLVAGTRVLESGPVTGTRVVELGSWPYGAAEPNRNLEGPELTAVLPAMGSDSFTLVLEVAGHPEYNSYYAFLLLDQ
jgi:hypothetical protein